MTIKTEKEYRERIDKFRPSLFFGGKKVEKPEDHRSVKSSLMRRRMFTN